MKRAILFFSAIFFTAYLFCQQAAEKNYLLTTSVNSIGYGMTNILDPYLSPFEYSGYGVDFQTISQKYLFPNDSLWSVYADMIASAGVALHPNKNNSMLFFNGNYNIGAHYHLYPMKNLTVLTGGLWEVDLGAKYLSRNVNNPVSMDLYTNVNVSAIVNYDFKLWKQDFRVQYGLRTPLLGCMFVPVQGISYYELFSLSNLKNAFHFSSIHNRRAITHFLNVDIPLNYVTFRAGIRHDFTQYSANELVCHKNSFTFQIGTVFDFYVFEGKQKRPKNFKSAY